LSHRVTFRGTIPINTQLNQSFRIPLDNGSFVDNFKVTYFEVYPNGGPVAGLWNTVTNNNDVTYVTLALDEDGLGYQNFGDNRQLSWFCAHSATTPGGWHSVIDPNHIIIEDLYIGAYCIDTGDGSTDVTSVPLNYIIHLEKVVTSEDEAVLHLVKERSQAFP